MPIKIPNDLPATRTLTEEGVVVMCDADAVRQDIRPLKIGLLNLMPNKIQTETQIARLVGATPLQVELTLVRISDHQPRHASADHMASFYRPWDEVKTERFDGFIITGAPVERFEYTDVTYWDEIEQIFEWTQSHVHSTFAICWAAQAAMYHFHRVPKHELTRKACGIFRQKTRSPGSPILRGFSDDFLVPISRWSEVRREDLPTDKGLNILAEDPECGLCLIEDPRHRLLCMFNHVEYDTTSLQDEYNRDSQINPNTPLPKHYYPNDDPAQEPPNRWRAHAHLLFGNWINEIYQTTPFDSDMIGKS